MCMTQGLTEGRSVRIAILACISSVHVGHVADVQIMMSATYVYQWRTVMLT
jgi:hypothetical protein